MRHRLPMSWPRPAGTVLAGVALLAMVHAAAAQGAAPAAIDRLVTDTLSAQQVPAMTVAAAVFGRLVYSKAFGYADLENTVPATPETRIRTASIAKSITAVAAMTLVEAGKLDLDAPVQKYCPPFPLKQWPITTRELLSHTSGIRHYAEGEPEHTQHYRWMADGFALFAAEPLLFQPGTGFQYSTYGYTVAGCAIEGAAGTPFAGLRRRARAAAGRHESYGRRRRVRGRAAPRARLPEDPRRGAQRRPHGQQLQDSRRRLRHHRRGPGETSARRCSTAGCCRRPPWRRCGCRPR